jgi:4-amino-4-deoxy-L-arabinose transferase-like glycosyltransferase
MQLAVTIVLTVLYVGLSLALGGVQPSSGMPWWFFVPPAVAFFASYVAIRLFAILPMSWVNKRRYGSSPRRVHLSWRGAVWFPVSAPLLLVPWYFLSILRMHFDLGWVLWLVVTLALALLTGVVLRRWREIRLLRGGEVAMALVDARQFTGEWTDRIVYHFRTAGGTIVSGRVWDAGYGVLEGSTVPVFYDANDPGDHVVACGCWFEAD